MEPPSLPVVCSWCSSPVPDGAERCGTCGASLVARAPETAATPDMEIPGITRVDPVLLARARVDEAKKSKRGLRERFTAVPLEEYADPIVLRPLTTDEREALKPPSEAVRLEMLRMEVEALQRAAQREAELRAAEERELAARKAPAEEASSEEAPAEEASSDGADEESSSPRG